MTRSKQHGFTLIEVMIVIAIIGILAAIAVPQYQLYVGKAQTSRLSLELAALRVAVEDCINHGRSQIGIDEGECDPRAPGSSLITGSSQVGMVLPSNYGVAQISNPVTVNTRITAIINNHVLSDLKGKKVAWIRGNQGRWHCETNIDSKYIISGCLHNASL
ncbi:pilin [Psychrobacter pygoscelis]|uniref:pilin n=1 Tax=Psychrobacter pygoscelis TaxID=2488563 RepID=UPI0010394CEC|nr:pilin [Psychrobacter pygoscelis]